jgi:CubicO group peptidase (beta-lactamase class C family)
LKSFRSLVVVLDWAAMSDELLRSLVPTALASVLGDRLAPPRMAVGMVDDGQLVGTFGVDANEHTRFRIASMTKSFTAAAVLQLRDRGAWKLDDPLSRWVPEALSLRGPTDDSPTITLRHLLTMTGGMATDDAYGDRLLDIEPTAWRAAMQAGAMFAVIPGTSTVYSNFGYALLGEAIARVARQSAQRYITNEILRPLGMSNTGWDVPQSGDVAMPYHRVADLEELPPLDDGGYATMGGLWSTVADLSKWVAFLCDAYPPRNDTEHPVLCRASRREMQSISASFPAPISDTPRGLRLADLGYGFGLMIGTHPGVGPVVNHSGGLPGYGSNMRWLPDAGFGLIALGNRTYTPMRLLTAELLELLVERGEVPPPLRRWPVAAPEVQQHGAALADAVWSVDGEAIHHLDYSMNLPLDLPLERRAVDASSFAADVGPLLNRTIEATTSTTGVVIGQTSTHTVRISFQLSSQLPPLLQWYELMATRRPQA